MKYRLNIQCAYNVKKQVRDIWKVLYHLGIKYVIIVFFWLKLSGVVSVSRNQYKDGQVKLFLDNAFI